MQSISVAIEIRSTIIPFAWDRFFECRWNVLFENEMPEMAVEWNACCGFVFKLNVSNACLLCWLSYVRHIRFYCFFFLRFRFKNVNKWTHQSNGGCCSIVVMSSDPYFLWSLFSGTVVVRIHFASNKKADTRVKFRCDKMCVTVRRMTGKNRVYQSKLSQELRFTQGC